MRLRIGELAESGDDTLARRRAVRKGTGTSHVLRMTLPDLPQ
jgi:hypothetical protein